MRCRRLNVGCGPAAVPDWVNSDVRPGPGVDVVHDIRDGLPFRSASFDYAVAIHVLQDLPYVDVAGALQELRRVLGAGGCLRLGLPDLDRAVQAYRAGDRDYFYVPDDDARSIGGKLCVQVAWYGSVRTPFTYDFVEEIARRAGFSAVWRCRFGETGTAEPDIASLDNRERESLFVEAMA
jgi:SAM-dependent methyltransferase